jgi:TolB-like protein
MLKKSWPVYFISLLFIVYMVGCAAFTKYGQLEKNARKSFEQGQFDTAFNGAVQALQMKPTYNKAQQLLQSSYRSSVTQHENKIESHINSADKFKWDAVVSEYEQLMAMGDKINNLPPLIDSKTKTPVVINTKDYGEQVNIARQNAAEIHYQEGEKLSKIQSLDSQKSAAKEFKKADEFVPGFKDASVRYETCRRAGIKRMAIIPFENRSGKSQYGAIEELITDDIISDVMGDPSAMEFLEIISRDQLMQVMEEQKLGMTGLLNDQTAVELGRILGVHELVTGKITQIMHRPAPSTPRAKTFREQARVATHTEKYRDKKGKLRERLVYSDVTAAVTRYEKTASASIMGSFQILDVATARIKKSQSFKGSGFFMCEWGEFRGDERALSNESRRLVSRTEEYVPTAEELVNEAARDLSKNLAETLKEYAR